MLLTAFIFFPEKAFYETPEDYGFQWQDVYVLTSDHVKLHGWYLSASEEKGTILFFHGNAGNISHRLFKVGGWLKRGFSVCLMDYRGYGKSEGKIVHGEDLMRDAEAFFKWLREEKKQPYSKIILYGESIGSAPAVKFASEHELQAVILEAPFTSFTELASIHYPFVPKAILKDFEFSNADRMANLKSPLFILHGIRDEICPYRMAEELFRLAPEPKGFFSVPHGGHNDLPMAAGEDFWEKPYRFVVNPRTS
jgi:hypothetical protein